MQKFLDAAFELIDEKSTTEFTIQEVIDRSGQSLRGFYQYFDGKTELLLALFEETIREATDDLMQVVESETDPLDRLRAFTIRLYEWCDPTEKRAQARHAQSPAHRGVLRAARVGASGTGESGDGADLAHDALAHRGRERRRCDRLQGRAAGGCAPAADRDVQLVQQPARGECAFRLSAEETWDFCLYGLRAPRAERLPYTRSRSSIRIALPRSTL